MNRQTPFAARKLSGFSLVEIMVAMTIGFIVVGAVGYLYISSRSAFRTTENMSRMQESARYALDTLSRDVRMAGFIGCGNLASVTPNTIANPPVPTINPGTAILGYDNGSGWTNPSSITRASGDVITIQGAFGGGVGLTGNLAPANANIQILGNPNGFVQGDVLMVTDCNDADVFRVTNVVNHSLTLSTLAHANSSNTGNRVGTYGPDASVYIFEQYHYFIGQNPAGRRALYRASIKEGALELVENVADMQVTYGRDTNGDRTADVYGDATSVGANWGQVVAARINLLISSPDNNVTTSPQTYNFNGSAVTAGTGDRSMYQVFTATIGIRNRLP
jgi:type IV pilus assembly protein PilW